MESNSQNQNNIQVSIAPDLGTESPTQLIFNRIYEEITNFFGRFDPRAQLFENTKNINPFAHTHPVTS